MDLKTRWSFRVISDNGIVQNTALASLAINVAMIALVVTFVFFPVHKRKRTALEGIVAGHANSAPVPRVVYMPSEGAETAGPDAGPFT